MNFKLKQNASSIAASLLLLTISCTTLAHDIKDTIMHGHGVIQLGGYWSIQGKPQQININGLIGDYFTVTDKHDSNGLVGLGYFIDGQDKDWFKMKYGVNAFYLAKTGVNGNVVQEGLFTNLAYAYDVTHYPLYFVAKSTFKTKSPNHHITLDAGIGPNFIKTSNFHESSLDSVTIPDRIFSGKSTTTFTATAGIGIEFNAFFGKAPLECGYRFYYLGQGNFNTLSNQVLNNLNTGNNYANAVMCSITV